MNQKEVVDYCNRFLKISDFDDSCPNGLQVEGDARQVSKICLGVSISIEFIEKAIQNKADLIITHHGLLWNKDDRVIQGPLRKKIKLLLQSGIAAVAYHLPLDYHPKVGNNVQLAKKLGLTKLQEIPLSSKHPQGIIGNIKNLPIEDFVQNIAQKLERKPLTLPFGKKKLSKVAIATGGAQGFFKAAIEAGADCFISGEISESNFAMSKEFEVHLVSAGHYCTEKFGIQALGRHLQKKIKLNCEFIDIPNPI